MSVPAADELRDLDEVLGSVKFTTLTAAADLLDAIDALHQPLVIDFGVTRCLDCGQLWPCKTARLLHPEAGEA